MGTEKKASRIIFRPSPDSDNDLPFRVRAKQIYLLKEMAGLPKPVAEYHWHFLPVETDAIRTDGFAYFYSTLAEEFANYCNLHHVPKHNAFAFWDFIESEKGLKIPDKERQFLILAAGISYGDLFNYATVRMLPRGFVMPDSDQKSPGLNQKIDDSINSFQHSALKYYALHTPEGKKSWTESAVDSYEDLLYEHIETSKKYTLLQNDVNHDFTEYTKPNYGSDKWSSDKWSSEKAIITKLKIAFSTYIHLLKNSSNSASNHRRFESAESNEQLTDNISYLCSFIKPGAVLGKIAPAFLYLVFKKHAKDLYTSELDFSERHINALLSGTNREKQLILHFDKTDRSRPKNLNNDKVQTNTLYPVQCALFMYRVLCCMLETMKYEDTMREKGYNPFAGTEWVRENRSTEAVDIKSKLHVDQKLCDYIVALDTSIVGLRHYHLTENDLDNLSTKFNAEDDRKKYDGYVHPLLCTMLQAQGDALELHPSSIPQIYQSADPDYNSDSLLMEPGLSLEGIKAAKLEADIKACIYKGELSKYKDIILKHQDGLGNVPLGLDVRFQFSNYLDDLFSKCTEASVVTIYDSLRDNKVDNHMQEPIQDDEYRTNCMGYIERLVHLCYESKIKNDYIRLACGSLYKSLYRMSFDAMSPRLVSALLHSSLKRLPRKHKINMSELTFDTRDGKTTSGFFVSAYVNPQDENDWHAAKGDCEVSYVPEDGWCFQLRRSSDAQPECYHMLAEIPFPLLRTAFLFLKGNLIIEATMLFNGTTDMTTKEKEKYLSEMARGFIEEFQQCGDTSVISRSTH